MHFLPYHNRQRIKAANKKTDLEQEEKLAAKEAQVLALRTAIQTWRERIVALFSAPSVFGNTKSTQDGMLAVFPFQPYRTQAINLLFSNLAVQYPAINEFLFKMISENTLTPVNVFKLSIYYTPDWEKIKVLKVNNTLAVHTLEEDAMLSEVKESLHLIRCFFLYCTILLHFTPLAICNNITIGLHAYINRLLGFILLYS